MRKLIFALPLIALAGCATAPQMTSLEIQAMQKKNFEAEKKILFAATLSVFQDLGYTVRAADLNTGYIQAQSPTKSDALSAFFGTSRMSNTEATAFIEEMGPAKSSARLNFVAINESSSAYGMKSKADQPILDPKIYENAFSKIQEAVFIRQHTQ